MSDRVNRVAEAIRAINSDTIGLSYSELTTAMAGAAINAMIAAPDMTGTLISATGLLVIVDCPDYDTRAEIHDWLEGIAHPPAHQPNATTD